MSFSSGDQLQEIPFVDQAWERWLADLGPTYNVNPLDLFYWDHWAGNFAGIDQAEGDLVMELHTVQLPTTAVDHALHG